jgi:hypothetical protein
MLVYERLVLARGSELGQNLFPLECGAEFCNVSGVEILCLTDSQLQDWLSKHSFRQETYPAIMPITEDPIPKFL